MKARCPTCGEWLVLDCEVNDDGDSEYTARVCQVCLEQELNGLAKDAVASIQKNCPYSLSRGAAEVLLVEVRDCAAKLWVDEIPPVDPLAAYLESLQRVVGAWFEWFGIGQDYWTELESAAARRRARKLQERN